VFDDDSGIIRRIVWLVYCRYHKRCFDAAARPAAPLYVPELAPVDVAQRGCISSSCVHIVAAADGNPPTIDLVILGRKNIWRHIFFRE
jgi:hypothetical protein